MERRKPKRKILEQESTLTFGIPRGRAAHRPSELAWLPAHIFLNAVLGSSASAAQGPTSKLCKCLAQWVMGHLGRPGPGTECLGSRSSPTPSSHLCCYGAQRGRSLALRPGDQDQGPSSWKGLGCQAFGRVDQQVQHLSLPLFLLLLLLYSCLSNTF